MSPFTVPITIVPLDVTHGVLSTPDRLEGIRRIDRRCSRTVLEMLIFAAQFDRKVAFVGRGMMRNSEIAQRLGYLRIPAGVQIRDSEIANYPSQDILCLSTGTQGEPMSALSRIAIDDHR